MTPIGDKILLVDDDSDLVWAMNRRLTQAGFAVTACGNGEEAHDALESQNFDFLFTDVMMPKMNGLALVDWVRTNRPKIKTLVMTAFDSPSVRQLSLSAGAAVYLEKPADPDLIIEMLRSREGESVS